MKAIILAGGHGTRLRPITYEIPKPLVPVKKKPIITHLSEFLQKHGVSEIGVLASREHEPDFQRWHELLEAEGMPGKVKIFYEDERRGTFGGMELVKEWIGNEPFVFTNGDELKDFDLLSLKNFHEGHEGLATIWMVEVPNAHEYGVPITDESNKILEFLEKPENPPSNYINSGLYMLSPEVMKYADFSQEGEIMIERHIFPQLAKEGRLYGHKCEGRWYDCGNIERWERAIKEW